MHGRLVVVAVVGVVARPGHAEGWRIAADVRAAGTVEVDGGATMQRSSIVPAMTLLVGHPAGPLVVHGRARLGIPAYYGQLGAGGGVGLEVPLSASREVLAFALTEAGVQLTYADASPEVSYDDDALMYWGPYARVEGGLRLLQETPSGSHLALVLSVGVSVVDARFLADATGRGTRVEPDLGVGGEVRF